MGEGASIDHDDMGAPELSNSYESMFFGIDQTLISMDTMDPSTYSMESQPNLSNAEDETLSASPPKNYQSMPIGTPDNVGFDAISIFSSSGQLSTTPAYSELRASLSRHLRPTIPASVMYNGNFERLEPLFERCGSILCL